MQDSRAMNSQSLARSLTVKADRAGYEGEERG